MFSRILFVVLLFAVPLSVAATTDSGKIAQVASGEIKEARASWWGFDAEDSTKALQAALDSKVPVLIVDRQAGPWITGPLTMQSDQEIRFEEGVEVTAKQGLFHGKAESLFSASNRKNVKLIGLGNGAVLRMRKADYHTDAYEKSEWRHALAVRSCENVHVENLSLVSSGGDGIYLGVATRGVPCRNVVIRKVICDDNNRQGISVISADKLLIEDCVLKNTWGTPPAAGIDFEPNAPNEQLTDCVMRRCVVENNAGDAIVFYLPNLLQSNKPISVRLEQCVVKSGKRYGFHFITRDTPELTLKGTCDLVDCRFENCEAGGISIVQKAVDGVAVTMKNTEIVHCGNREKSAPVQLVMNEFGEFGGIDFGEIRIRDEVDRLPVFLTDLFDWPKKIRGSLVLERTGQKEAIDDAWFAKYYPNRLKPIPLLKPEPSAFRPEKKNDASVDTPLPTFWARKTGTFWMYAEKGTPLRFALGIRKIGRTEIGRSSAALTGPDGVTKKFTISPENAASFEYTIDSAPADGVYELRVDVGMHAVRMIRCNVPIVLPASPRLGLIASTGRLYLTVPKGAKEFGIRIRGEGAEAVKASVVDPTGKTVWTEDAITSAMQFDRTAEEEKIDGTWQILLERPTGMPFEDYGITILGVPPLLGF